MLAFFLVSLAAGGGVLVFFVFQLLAAPKGFESERGFRTISRP